MDIATLCDTYQKNVNLNISIGKFVESIVEFKDIQLFDNQEVNISDLHCYVSTPTGKSQIDYIIKKENLVGLTINLENNIEIKCAKKHILQQSSRDVYASSLKIGDSIDTISGLVKIVDITTLTDTTFYDIGIEAPHIYYDSDGVVHHNTLITAALSYSCEAHGKSIVIVPNKSLVTQTEADYRNLGLDVGVYYGDRKEFGHTHTICTWQSINILMKKSQECSESASFGLLRDPTNVNIHDLLDGVVCIMVDECFDGDNKVLTPTGYVAIKDIKSGDLIVNYSENLKEFKIDTVVKQHINLTKSSNEKMYELQFDDATIIKVTGNHKFLTNLGWCRADELTETHNIMGEISSLVSRTEIEKPHEVYNLHIENDHNYIVEGAVVSNCHMAKAEVLKTMLTGVMGTIPIRWGLTGTIPKEPYEFVSLRCSIGEVIGQLSAKELQDQGVLANCHVNIMQLIDYVEYADYQSEVRYLLENQDRLKYISNLIEKLSADGNTLILVDRIASGKALVELINGATFVSGVTKANARKEQYDEVATSDNKVIVATYGVAAVGINIPRIFNLVLVEPGKSFVRVIQSIGRGIRKAEDKDFVQIYDLTSTCKFAKRHLTKRKVFYKDAGYPFTVNKIDWKSK